MSSLFANHKGFWTRSRKNSMYLGVLILLLSLIIQVTVGHYSSRQAADAKSVSDIFLDNLPVIDLGFMIVGGAIALWVFTWSLLILRPRYLVFGTKAVALFVIFRSFFTSLTHIGAYPTGIAPSAANNGYGLYHLLTYQGNFFFSGHTGFPFLMALIFWDNVFLRRLFIVLTIMFGATMLLAHVHYSIDVFAAPFIVYGVFIITSKLFPGDYALLNS